jgi:hypothetical protein
MTDEVKAALKWWQDYGSKQRHPYSDSILEKVALLANAFAAEHPADDDEPVTVEWLLAEGFIRSEAFTGYLMLFFEGKSKDSLFAKVFDEGIGIFSGPGREQLQFNPTRGQLRRLLSALEER